jgi:hypothetical protein
VQEGIDGNIVFTGLICLVDTNFCSVYIGLLIDC